MARQSPRLGMQLHWREPLNEGIPRANGGSVEQPDAVMMRRQRRVRRHGSVDLRWHEGMPRHRSAAAGRAAHICRSHTVGRVWQRHCGAVRIGDDRLCGIVRQSRRGGLYADVVALGKGGHPHVGRPTERFLVRIQRIRELRSRELAADHDRRLIRILQNDRRATGADLVAGDIAVGWHVVHVLRRREGLAGARTTVGRREGRVRCRWLRATLKGAAAPLLARFLARLSGQVVYAGRPTLGAAMTGVAGVTRVTVHAAGRLAVAAGVAVTGHRTSTAAAAHCIQRRRV